jgi:hypothetical protein
MGSWRNLDRQAALWISHAPNLLLGGIRITPKEAADLGITGETRNEHIFISNPADIAKGLAGIWKMVFGVKRHVSKKAIKRVLRDYSACWDWSGAKQFSWEMLAGIVSKAKTCAGNIYIYIYI